MVKVQRIEWTFHTGDAEGSGTDERVSIQIYRDDQLLVEVDQEPGETARLDRGEVGTYWWEFQDPSGLGTAVSGVAVPYTEDFPDDVVGHLKVVLRIHGGDAWRIGTIESQVVSGRLESVPGSIDSVQWVEERQSFFFPGEDVMSNDSAEGITTLSLNY